ncbi:response regulator transcription factor [Streptomyces sp. MBT53]|uniref:response regulator transcription factor n=1 Tax=Streptomyces sp. MBT53 TaxID=1488384 RepID=UPI001913C804|nr:LuxR C-terminal-related transcriptional regulator [Streptomyces sp. MBT53]MBK6019197.1 helix-turn-helix transcriptional regulator [Streptomyces sp. MBT53]
MRTAICERQPLVLMGLAHLLSAQSSCDVVFTSADALPGAGDRIDVLVVGESVAAGLPETWTRSGAGDEMPDVVVVRPDATAEEVLRSVSEAVARSSTASVTDRPAAALSPREQEVLRFIALGMTHGQVARRIGISHHTVDTYVKRVRSKFSVGNKAELTRIALGLMPL